MDSKTSSYRDALLESLSDPIEAAHYLNAAISDSPEMFLKALRNVAQSRRMAKVARDAGVTRESLYRATSEIGNPTLDTLDSVLSAMGIKIKFEADASDSASAPTASTPSSLATTDVSAPTDARTSHIQGIGTSTNYWPIGTLASHIPASYVWGWDQNLPTAMTAGQLNPGSPKPEFDFTLNTETANPAFAARFAGELQEATP